jgi:equilibrative nucleoside transporter 1/2/3
MGLVSHQFILTVLIARNMFLAAAPYFHRRFVGSEWIRLHFQSAILSISTVSNLGCMFVLQKMQEDASYPKRIVVSLLMNIAIFSLLATSTQIWTGVSPAVYLVFLLIMVFGTSTACGLMQNGGFAYAAGFGRSEYTQAIMTGQAIAGVLPCVAQIVAVLAFPDPQDGDDDSFVRLFRRSNGEATISAEASKSALYYFLTAVFVATFTLGTFLALIRRHTRHHSKHFVSMSASIHSVRSFTSVAPILPRSSAKAVPLSVLFSKLRLISLAIFICFAVTILYPVFTESVVSVHPITAGRFYEPEIFIPLAFLLWNSGDLIGRLLTLHIPIPSPLVLFVASLARFVFPPLYFLCNLHDRGAKIKSDFFYLFVVQLWFGLTNGFLGSAAMMKAGEEVDPDEREAAGGFMGLMLVGGLTVGSLLSFTLGRL